MSSGDLDQSTVTWEFAEAGSAETVILAAVLSAAFGEAFTVLSELLAEDATVS